MSARRIFIAAAVALACSSVASSQVATFPPLTTLNVNQAARSGYIYQAIIDTAKKASDRCIATGGLLNNCDFGLSGQPSASNCPAGGCLVNQYKQVAAAGVTPDVGPKTWMSVLQGLIGDLPWPLKYATGDPNNPVMRCADGTLPQNGLGCGGSGGGGGSGGSWPGVSGSAAGQCDNLRLELDPQGNLIVPSYSFETGSPFGPGDKYTVFYSPDGNTRLASSKEAGHLWSAHLNNMREPDKRKWLGALNCWTGWNPNQPGNMKCIYRGVAFRDQNGVIQSPRPESVDALDDGLIYPNTANVNGDPKSCPEGGGSGGLLDYYGFNAGISTDPRNQNCTHYIKNFTLSPSGYAYSPRSSIPAWALEMWPTGGGGPNAGGDWYAIPRWILACGIDPSLIKKLVDAGVKRGCTPDGSNGWKCPGTPVDPTDVRPGDTQVNDLADNPGTAPASPQPGPNVNDPPPPQPGTGTPGGGFQDTCDFGDCSDPGVGVSDPTDPTNIFDPIFNWLPDLPSITLNSQSLQCPVWNLNLTSFGGPQWQWLIDSHCTLMDYDAGHGTLASVLGALMLAVWGIGAAVIILRA